ncbi:MAG: HEAT repeat domain-containing protein [Candidatus Lokiarchaeota archaeon]|nr:HEAT repeat domain-containing protein [Candidatus Lokiarchaeota archaeon]
MNWHEKNAEFNALIKQLFHDNDWQKRAEAARQLGMLKEGRATNLMCRALRSENDYIVINKIIEALGRIGDGRATLRIIEKLKEEQEKNEIDKFRIIYILESLIKLKDKRALSYLGPLLDSSDENIKNLALKAFDVIEPNWKEIIERERTKSIQEIFKPKE